MSAIPGTFKPELVWLSHSIQSKEEKKEHILGNEQLRDTQGQSTKVGGLLMKQAITSCLFKVRF